MDFDFSDDQRMLAESAHALLRKEYGLARRRAQIAKGAEAMDRDLWRQWGDLGWLGVTIPEAFGGIGQDLVSAMALLEAFGDHLVLSPFVETVIQSARLIDRLGSAEQREAWLPRVAVGEAVLAFAHDGRSGLRVDGAGGDHVLNGEVASVAHAAVADRWIVTAAGKGGLSAFLVDPGTAGIAVWPHQGIDGTPLAHLVFEDVRLPASAVLGPAAGAGAAVAQVEADTLAAACVESLGAMARLHALTLDYVKMRRQFGVAIGSFQAIQHRLVEMYLKLELARPLAWLAVSAAGMAAPARRARQAAAMAQVSDSGRHIGEEAIQLHGGIGMTDEAEPSHAFRRLIALERRLGGRDRHLATLAAALAGGEPTLYA